MDLSKLSDNDLRALSQNKLSDMSDEGLKFIANGGVMPEGKKGLGAALGKGFESYLGAGQTTLESLFGANEAAQRGLAREEKLGEKYADQIGLDKLKEAYEKRGLTGGAGELIRQVPLALAEQAPNIAASLASARLGGTAGSVFGPWGAGIGALIGAVAPSAIQSYGSDIQRQAQEQTKAGKPVDIDVGSALGATAIQAPLDAAGTFIPMGGKIAGKIFGPEVEKLLARGATKGAEKLAEESFIKTLSKGLGVGALAEIPTEILQQVAERAQAGLSLTSPEALKEYGETAYQVGLLAPIGGAGRFVDKSAARTQIEEKKQQDALVAKEEARKVQEQQNLEKAAQDLVAAQQGTLGAKEEPVKGIQGTTGQLFGEALPEASPLAGAPSTLTVREREATELSQLEAQKDEATDPVQKRELETQIARLKEAPTEQQALIKNYDLYQEQLTNIEKQRDVAAEKGDFKAFGALDAQAKALETQNKDLLKQLETTSGLHYLKEQKKYVAVTPEVEMAKLRGEQKNLIKQLQGMAGPMYDAKKAATLTAKLEEIEKKIADVTPAASQLDLFDTAQMGAEERQAKAQQNEARAQEQADLFAQVQQPGRKEVLDEEVIKRYQQGLQDLEDAYAAGADERIINNLVAELQRVGQEKDLAVAKSTGVTGPEQEQGIERLQRIKRAIDEENAKLYDAETNEEVATIRANVAALQKRYTAAQTDRANVQPENLEIEANQEQKDAVLQAVEAARLILSGDYLNSRNVDVASSLKSAIEDKIREAGGTYITAAIKEINAVRALSGAIKKSGSTERIGGQKPLTNDEALKIASAIKERFDYLANDPTYLAEKVRDTNLKTFTQALDRIKTSYFKGASKLHKATPILKQERDVLGMLNKEKAALAKRPALEKRLKALEEKLTKLKKQESIDVVNTEIASIKKELDYSKNSPARIEQINKEIAARKEEDDRSAAEKAKKEQVELPGVNPDQRELFGERQLEPIATVRATPENFRRFVDIQANKFNQAKQAAERAIAAAKERADKAKAKATENAQELLKQIDEQKAFVQDVAKAHQVVSDLRSQAARLWQERGRLVKQLKDAPKENRESIRNAIKEIDATADTRLAQIDELHARANEIQNANLEYEQKLLDRLEKAYAKTPDAKSKQLIAAKRAAIGKEEAAIKNEQERQLKEKRAAEQQALEFKESLPSTTRETVETLTKVKGKKQEVLRREKVVTKQFPFTAEEKRAKAIEKARAGAAERIADRKAIEERLAKGMSGTVANAKEKLVTLEAQLKAKEDSIKENTNKVASINAKLKEGVSSEERAELAKQKRKLTSQTTKAVSEQKELKEKVQVLRNLGVSAERGAETIAAQPGRVERKKGLKTGVKKVDVTKEGLKIARDVEQEARDLGISRDDYEFVEQGLAFGFKAREETAITGKGMTSADVNKELSKIKLPKGLEVIVIDKTDPRIDDLISSAGGNPKAVKGAVMANGKVLIIAGNHADIKDIKATIAHELIGHIGVESLLGEAGMKALLNKIAGGKNGLFRLATDLGVFDDAQAAYLGAIKQGKTADEASLTALREIIAHTEEATPNKSFLEKAKDFIKAMVGAVRSALRKMGLDLDISTNDIFKILRDARKQFNGAAPGAYVNKDGDIMFRSKPPKATAGFEDVLGYSDNIVAKEKSLIDKIKGEATGLIFKTKYIDRFAPVQAVVDKMKDSLKATQLMYFLRMHDQRMAWTSEVASHGPMDLVQAKDGKGLIIESKEGANLKDMAAALKDAGVGNAEATSRIFTMYLAAKRAKRVGLEKLNFGKEVTQKMLDDTVKAVEASPSAKEAFEKAAGIYAEYNKGLVNFAVKTGAISKDVGAQLLKDGDYVPFYRQRDDGSVWLDIGGAPAIKIGNLADQPYLHELVGGDKPIFDVYTSALQNTSMLTDMALRNLATRNTAFALGDMGLLKLGENEKGTGIRKGDGPKGATVIRFKIDGENYWADVNTKDVGIPSELLVKGLEGVNTSLPNIVKAMNVPANLLRKGVTRNPAYALRQVVRDPLNAVMTTGLDTTPVLSSFKEISKMIRGKSEGEPLLQHRGILGGQVLTGTSEDMTKILRDITSGKKGWEYRMAQLDQLAIQGDAATRVVMYNNFIKQGLSEMEATLATLESMNFSKRGISPSLFALSTMVPFMNAQIQGLNVLYQAFTGKMPFNEKLKVKQKLIQRGLMMMAFTMLYASMMQDDESYQNANDDEKYGNWFLPNPFGEEHIKVPIPFEIGLIFKAIPEAIANTMWGDEKARDTMSAISKMAWNSVPISGPQGIKPLLETAINYSFFTGRPIESERLQRYEPGERYSERTTELAKMIGGALNISPTKIEYLVRGYTGSLPLAIASLANPILRSSETGEQPEPRGLLSSETPLVGSFFQAKDASGLVNKAYKDMEEVNQSKETYKKMLEEGREKEAEAYMEANADMIAMGTMAGKFRKKMGDLTKMERNIRADSTMTGGEKREALDEIKQMKIDLAKMFSSERG